MGGRVWDEDLGEWVRAVDTEDEQRPVEKLPLETGPKGQRPVVVAPRSVEKSPSSCKNGHPWTPENTVPVGGRERGSSGPSDGRVWSKCGQGMGTDAAGELVFDGCGTGVRQAKKRPGHHEGQPGRVEASGVSGRGGKPPSQSGAPGQRRPPRLPPAGSRSSSSKAGSRRR
jgi:hypothetical protein